ncbi:MAG: response regulator transcription factor [Bacteroidia bacterium]|nr:response regulator transcription factor [Bacteroidia bacterium]MCZ2247862.1 response regulator transcription factor [Bacteroidia bacterium]
MIYIAIVDDKKNIRFTLKEKLNNMPNFNVVFTAENGKDFLKEMREARNSIEPHVVLMDIDMPIMNGIEAVAEGKLRYPKMHYLMLTIFDEDEKIFNAIKAGADGYLLKDEPLEKISEAIESLMKGESAPMSPSIARKVLNLLTNTEQKFNKEEKTGQENEHNLTEREKEILTLLVDGLEYKEIAIELGLSPNTVRNNVTKIYSKLHVTSRIQAARVVGKR